jgi:hypothetical protein
VPTQDSRIIPVDQISKAPRGRKANVNADLLTLLKQVKPGYAANLESIFGSVEKSERSRVSQIVRTHWKMCHDTRPSVNYSPSGVCQVSHAK